MKLGSLKGGRDGRLVVVSADLAWCADATHIAPTLQSALDDWDSVAPQLHNLATDLAHEAIPMMRFHERQAQAPLPRAFQRVSASAPSGHDELAGTPTGTTAETGAGEPPIYQAGSDRFLPPRDAIALPDTGWNCDFSAEVIVVTGDVARGANREEALGAIRLIGLVNDLSFSGLMPDERARGLGFVRSKPAPAMSPVLVTPDELGDAWREGKLHGLVAVDLNGRAFGRMDAGTDTMFDFATLVSHLAATRPVGAGSVIGSGILSNRDPDGAGRPVDRGGRGFGCIAEQRMVETNAGGSAAQQFLQPGDTVQIRMDDDQGHAIFGTIDQTVSV
jgi:fumarylacetoacetate (FAA) hydrolase